MIILSVTISDNYLNVTVDENIKKLELISFKEASIGDGEFMRARNVLQKLDTRNAKSKTFNFDLQLSRTLEIDLQQICVKNVFVSNGNENIGGEFTAT